MASVDSLILTPESKQTVNDIDNLLLYKADSQNSLLRARRTKLGLTKDNSRGFLQKFPSFYLVHHAVLSADKEGPKFRSSVDIDNILGYYEEEKSESEEIQAERRHTYVYQPMSFKERKAEKKLSKTKSAIHLGKLSELQHRKSGLSRTMSSLAGNDIDILAGEADAESHGICHARPVAVLTSGRQDIDGYLSKIKP